MTSYIEAQIPEWALPAIGDDGGPFCNSRYIAIHGGRAGGKSHFVAERIVLRAYHPNKMGKDGIVSPVRIVCIREVQNSLKESVKQLIADKIHKLGLSEHFDILDAEIRGPHDSLIIFKGMQAHNASNIKSLEGFDIAWVEEAQTLSEVSLRMLRPTIRKSYADGTSSQLVFTWNPRFETDPVDQFFRGNSPEAKGWAKPRNATIIECNWHDNPWLDDTIYNEKDGDYESDPEMAEHVWGGGYERVTAGAYYANQIANLERLGRIGNFPYDPALGPVYTSWDIGVDDYTSIWFTQIYHPDGKNPRVRVIDYFEFTGFGAEDIVRSAMPEYTPDIQERVTAYAEIGRDRGYKYQRHFFPHDLGVREWGNNAQERFHVLARLGMPLSTLHRGVAAKPEDRIEASRQTLPMCEFNAVSRVQIGLSRLRRYQKKFNVNLGIYLGPQHDSNSHACLVAGSMVLMGDGSRKPVEAITAGEQVWTPSGISDIINAGVVKSASDFVTIHTSNGDTLKCTPEHKILTRRGFVLASSLTTLDKILTGRGLAASLISLCSRAANTGYRDHIIDAMSGTKGIAQTCIETSGKKLMVQSLMDGMSIMLTGTRSTTTCQTYKLSTAQSICAPTHSSLLRKGSCDRQRKPLWQRLLNGMGQPRVLSGTARMERLLGKVGNGTKSAVKSAAKSITRRILIGLSSATEIVRLEREAGVSESQLVYDLTVRNHACYQANGLMVSNSDAFGEFCINAGVRAAVEELPKPPKSGIVAADYVIAPALPGQIGRR